MYKNTIRKTRRSCASKMMSTKMATTIFNTEHAAIPEVDYCETCRAH